MSASRTTELRASDESNYSSAHALSQSLPVRRHGAPCGYFCTELLRDVNKTKMPRPRTRELKLDRNPRLTPSLNRRIRNSCIFD